MITYPHRDLKVIHIIKNGPQEIKKHHQNKNYMHNSWNVSQKYCFLKCISQFPVQIFLLDIIDHNNALDICTMQTYQV